MARVTVEDCLENVDNRFELVLTASQRARQIANGKEPLVDWENDKPTVVALREIAEGLVTTESLSQQARQEAEAEEVGIEATEDALDAEIRGMFAAATTPDENAEEAKEESPAGSNEPEAE